MTDVARLFGFGSYFKADVQSPNDVDLLILHHDVDAPSIDVAIEIKSLLTEQVPRAHIVMLSEPEERDLGFLMRSGATLLETFQRDGLTEQVHAAGPRFIARRPEWVLARLMNLATAAVSEEWAAPQLHE